MIDGAVSSPHTWSSSKYTELDRGVLLQSHHLVEKLARFNRERIPGRVVHAVGTGAYGHLAVTNPDVPCWAIIRCLTAEEAERRGGRDPGHIHRDLYDAIARGEYYRLGINHTRLRPAAG